MNPSSFNEIFKITENRFIPKGLMVICSGGEVTSVIDFTKEQIEKSKENDLLRSQNKELVEALERSRDVYAETGQESIERFHQFEKYREVLLERIKGGKS